MASLVIAEHDNVSLKDATHKSVTAAAAVSSPVHILVAGENCAAVADAAAKIAGVGKVLLADSALYARMLAEPMEVLILSLADSYDAILAPATTTGKNILPRVAAKLDTPQISEILKVISPDTFERPIYAGNAVETLQAPEGKKIITVRTTAFKAAVEGGINFFDLDAFYGAVLGVVPERIGMPVRKGALVLKMCQNSFDIGPMLSACRTDTARTHRPNPIGFFGQLQGACFPTAKHWRI